MLSNGSAASGGSAKDASCLAEAGGLCVGTRAPSTTHPAGPFRHRSFPHSARCNSGFEGSCSACLAICPGAGRNCSDDDGGMQAHCPYSLFSNEAVGRPAVSNQLLLTLITAVPASASSEILYWPLSFKRCALRRCNVPKRGLCIEHCHGSWCKAHREPVRACALDAAALIVGLSVQSAGVAPGVVSCVQQSPANAGPTEAYPMPPTPAPPSTHTSRICGPSTLSSLRNVACSFCLCHSAQASACAWCRPGQGWVGLGCRCSPQLSAL